jgi:hypothetical protein
MIQTENPRDAILPSYSGVEYRDLERDVDGYDVVDIFAARRTKSACTVHWLYTTYYANTVRTTVRKHVNT